jgi:hypothetical protein
MMNVPQKKAASAPRLMPRVSLHRSRIDNDAWRESIFSKKEPRNPEGFGVPVP